ncbi:unnamed protein product [Closterium sp. NIES-53]
MFQHIKDLVELDDPGPKAWKLLRDVIQPNTLPMVIVLEKELAALSMRPGDDVKPVLDKIKDTYARMAAAGSNVSQMQQCTKTISVLDNSWDNLIPTLNTQQDQWTPEWLRQQILQEDFRGCHTGGAAANKTAEGYGAAGGSRGSGGGRGRGRGRGFGRGRGRGMKPPSGERARGSAVQGSGAQGDGAHGKADPGMFLMAEDVKGSEGDVGSVGKVVMHPLTHWVIDSGCTSHMTPRADLLDEVKPPGKIKFVAAVSGALLPVIGIGNAKVMGANGGLVGQGNVLLVESLSANLLSVRRLQKSKAKVTFGPTSCRAKLGKLLLWDLEEKSSCIKDLWQLPIIPWNGKPPATAAAAATAKATTGGEETAATAKETAASAPTYGALDAVKKVQQTQQPHGEVLAGVDATAAWAKGSSGSGEADWETWHERLCHVNFPMLQKLVKDKSLKGLEVKGAAKEIGSCPTCLETKFTKFPFSSGTGPAKAPLALVHMDVVGPMRAPSLSGSRYFLTIVDNHTRAVWVYPLKTMGEVAAAVLKEWMPRAQRESGHKVKVIHTDNGGEFIGADFEAVLKKKGIQHQLTRTTSHIESRYVDCGDDFGAGVSKRLSPFLARHGPGGNREVTAEGVDSDGRPARFKFKLHEDTLEEFEGPTNHDGCEDVCTEFAEKIVHELVSRLGYLEGMSQAKLFTPDEWPLERGERNMRCLQWLESLVTLFKADECEEILPASNKNECSFNAGLTAMLKTPDWRDNYPNLVQLWVAVAVLPLSTVECERGFSRQNIIKSWQRGSLKDARLGDLVCMSLMEYEPNCEEIVGIWRSYKKRNPHSNAPITGGKQQSRQGKEPVEEEMVVVNIGDDDACDSDDGFNE